MMRHSGKQILTKIARGAGAALICSTLLAPAAALAQSGGLIQAYVTDPLTSVAMGGYDPVSYFTGGEPQLGRADFEYYWHGVSWYFATPANRDVFARDPEIYAPQFGGHGAMSMARGYLSEGNPLIYEVIDNRLFLFYSIGNRDAFLEAQATARLRAMERWVVASANLPRF